jgi:uncharacterized protein (DUF305 family)
MPVLVKGKPSDSNAKGKPVSCKLLQLLDLAPADGCIPVANITNCESSSTGIGNKLLKKSVFHEKIRPVQMSVLNYSFKTNWKQISGNISERILAFFGVFLLTAAATVTVFCFAAGAQQTDAGKPVVVQPGAPGMPTKTLSSATKGTLPPASSADVEFMQGMIMHHSQAVEMTALIGSHTENKNLRSLGARISSSQTDEIKFMQRWLAARGQSVPDASDHMAGVNMPGMDMSHDSMKLMPGMLTPEQMDALRKAKGGEFDHLFLVGMIQHHNGALTMVKDLFDTAGAGQDAEIFNFATDADNTQRAEIRIMQGMLEKDQ